MSRILLCGVAWGLCGVLGLSSAVSAAPPRSPTGQPAVIAATQQLPQAPTGRTSLTDRRLRWPTLDQWWRVLTLRDYNTRVVVFCTTLLGCAAGLIGSFTLLRRRALMGDAVSHATLPGIGLAFILAVAWGWSSKSLLWLLAGATVTGLLGVAAILLMRNLTRLKEDTALGAVLSVFFGAGISLLGVIQQMSQGHAAGLEAFIYGKTASMGGSDAQLIAVAAVASILLCGLLFREFKLLCFDDQFANSQGYPVVLLDLVLMGIVVAVTIVGLQAVGLILMIALLVIPAAAARFWTQRLVPMVLVAAGLGALSGLIGAASSAIFPRLPSGAMIVLVCTGFFLFSLLLGWRRGVLLRWWRRRSLNEDIQQQHLLRAIYEILEARLGLEALADQDDAEELAESVSLEALLPKRSWSAKSLARQVRRAERAEFLIANPNGIRFTQRGLDEAERLTRQHRLWEIYLITHAEVATARVDRDADAIEHVLEPEIVAELEELLERQFPQFPASPHALGPASGGAHGV